MERPTLGGILPTRVLSYRYLDNRVMHELPHPVLRATSVAAAIDGMNSIYFSRRPLGREGAAGEGVWSLNSEKLVRADSCTFAQDMRLPRPGELYNRIKVLISLRLGSFTRDLQNIGIGLLGT
jgi:hypothetical protein